MQNVEREINMYPGWIKNNIINSIVFCGLLNSKKRQKIPERVIWVRDILMIGWKY